MKVYVAAHDRWAALYLKAFLILRGNEVLSTWHDAEFLGMEAMEDKARADAADRDIAEITAADGLLLIAGPDKYSGGKFVEAGIALGQGKPVCVLGRLENCLLCARCVRQASTPEGAILRLERA